MTDVSRGTKQVHWRPLTDLRSAGRDTNGHGIGILLAFLPKLGHSTGISCAVIIWGEPITCLLLVAPTLIAGFGGVPNQGPLGHHDVVVSVEK